MKYDFDPVEEILKILGDAQLSEVLNMPEKHLTIGQRAHLGRALQTIGAELESKAKGEVLERVRDEIHFMDYGVVFSHWPEREQIWVNINAVKEHFPTETHDHLYNTKHISETVAIRIGKSPK